MVFFQPANGFLRSNAENSWSKSKVWLDRGQSILSESEFPLHAQNLALYKYYFVKTWVRNGKN